MNQKVITFMGANQDEINDAIKKEANNGYKVESISTSTLHNSNGSIIYMVILFQKN